MKNSYFQLATEKRGEFVSLLPQTQTFARNVGGIDDAVEYMVQNTGQRLPVPALASAANISLSHFFTMFKQRMGCSPLAYHTRLRMGRACLLLDSTSARVKDVAEVLGYEDAFYFSRVFKSWTTVAPRHYQKLGAELRLDIKNRLRPNNEKLLSPAAPVAISLEKRILVDDQSFARNM